jgi:hypothetical protein
LKEIPLYNKKKEIVAYTIVDDDKYDFLIQWRWRKAKDYVVRGERKDGKYKTIWMHRVIMDCPDGLEVDHIFGNKLDNRKEMLRICNHEENGKNLNKQKKQTSSIYKGVCSLKSRNKWSANIVHNDKQYWLGQFETELEAAKVYNIYARKYFGEFAMLNDIPEQNIIVNYRSYESQYKGVYLTQQSTWTARIWYNKKTISLGVYQNEEDAARAYNRIAYQCFGETTELNPVDNWENFELTKKKIYKKECFIPNTFKEVE